MEINTESRMRGLNSRRTVHVAWCAVAMVSSVAILLLQPPVLGPDRSVSLGPPCAEAASSLCTTGSIVDAIVKNLKTASYTPDEITSALLGTVETFKITGYNRFGVLGRAVFKNKTAINATKQFTVKDLHPDLDKTIASMVLSGNTNLQLMNQGYAPIGPDGLQINLHHMIGQEPGPMIEITAGLHQQHSKVLHGFIEASFKKNPSLKSSFDSFRKKYWTERAKDFIFP